MTQKNIRSNKPYRVIYRIPWQGMEMIGEKFDTKEEALDYCSKLEDVDEPQIITINMTAEKIKDRLDDSDD